MVLLSALLCIYGVLTFAPAAATLQSLQAGMEAPDFSLASLGGGTKSFSDVRGGKLTVLVFWSTWSPKSQKLLERMQQLHQKYGGQGLSIIGVNADEQTISETTLVEIKTLSEKLHISFPMLVDQGLIAFHDYGVIALPTTVILDGERLIKYELSGYPLVGSETMVDYLLSEMGGEKAAAAAGKAEYLPDKKALRFYNMGTSSLKSKGPDQAALMWFKKAAVADPAFVLPHLSLGEMYLRQGDVTLARGEFKEALVREPGNPIALCELGMIMVNEGKLTEGMTLFENARKTEETYAPCYYYSGYAYGKENKPEEALKMFDEAEKINPLDYRNFVYQGKFFEDRKDLSKAFAAYKKALGLILHSD